MANGDQVFNRNRDAVELAAIEASALFTLKLFGIFKRLVAYYSNNRLDLFIGFIDVLQGFRDQFGGSDES